MWKEQVGYLAPDVVNRYPESLDVEGISLLRQEREVRLWEDKVSPYRDAVQSVMDIKTNWFDLSGDVISAGKADELTPEQKQRWEAALQAFRPWKKGPFKLFGTDIDSEWRSDWKWNRIQPHIQPLKGRRVADVGCHNGYFMFRMAEDKPECVVGFEPFAKHFWNFQLIQNLTQKECLSFELLGVEHIDRYPKFFDTIFCLGILYHHTDPVGLLRKLRAALAPGGEIVVDCQGIPGEAPVSLTPRGRYARARGIWFLPTLSCLRHWMTRAGFQRLNPFFSEPLSIREQRRTSWADVDSLEEFLNPNDPSLTDEGYPAPWRHYILARK